jgi:hypothetical protein
MWGSVEALGGYSTHARASRVGEAAGGMQGKSCGASAQAIVNKCVRVRQGQLVDDTTCLVVDARPYEVPTFKAYAPDWTRWEGSMLEKVCNASSRTRHSHNLHATATVCTPQPQLHRNNFASHSAERERASCKHSALLARISSIADAAQWTRTPCAATHAEHACRARPSR